MSKFKRDRENEVDNIVIGDKVKSYDFDAVDDCYYEGNVFGIDDFHGCLSYRILAEKRIFKGVECKDFDEEIFAPVNGTNYAFGKTNGVKLV